MYFVDKQNDLFIRVYHFFDNGFEAFFKLAFIFGACNEGRQVEAEYFFTRQGFRYVMFDNAPGNTFYNGGFTYPWIADHNGVVFLAAAEDMQYAANLFVAADDRVEFAVFGLFRQVDGVFLERVVNVFGCLFGDFPAFAEFFDGSRQRIECSAAFAKQARCFIVAFNDTEQQQFERDIFVAKIFEHSLCCCNSFVGFIAQVLFVCTFHLGGFPDEFIQFFFKTGHIDARFFQ